MGPEPTRLPPPMAFFELAPGVTFCIVEGTPIFLDLNRDRYLRLQGDSADAFMEAMKAGGNASPCDPAVANLLAGGLIVPVSVRGRLEPASATAPAASVVEEMDPATGPRLLLLPELLADLLRIRARLKRGSLPSLVEDHRSAGTAASGETAPARDLAKDYLAARRLVPIRPGCLLDSLAMGIFLRRRGLGARLVFGVKLAPFGAHCWLQSGETILNDSLGNACDFTPVLVA